MTYLFENQNPAVMANGLNTNKTVSLGSTVSVTGAVTVSGAITATGAVSSATTVLGATGIAATTVGGATTPALLFSATDGFGIYFGTGYPTITAAQGSLYTNRTGTSTSTRLWVNYGGTSGWNSVTTSA